MADKFINTDPHDVERVEAFEKANRRMPWVIYFVGGLLLYFGMSYIDNFGGNFDYAVYYPIKSTQELEAQRAAVAADADPLLALGSEKYAMICSACHQPSGKGQANLAPPLAGSEWVNAEEPDRIIRVVLHGLMGPVEVNGETWNLAMAPLGGSLTDEEVAAVLTYIRQNQDWGNSAPRVDPEKVSEIREAEGSRSMWTADELAEYPGH